MAKVNFKANVSHASKNSKDNYYMVGFANDKYDVNPENQTCRLTKTMRFKKYKNDAYKKNGERGPIQHDQSPPFFFHLNPL